MKEKNGCPDPNDIFPNEFGTTCFLKNVVKAPNIEIGDYTCYDDAAGPRHFEERNVLFNWPQFGDRLVIGKSAPLAAARSLLWVRPTTGLAAHLPTRSPCSAAGGRSACRRTWASFRAGATLWWATTCGSAACER